MTQEMSKKNSIYFQLFLLLFVSALISSAVFWIMDYVGSYAVQRYYRESGYEEKRDLKYMSDLQNYVDENQISSDRVSEFASWVHDHKIVAIRVYKENRLIYDSLYPGLELQETDTTSLYYEDESTYPIQCTDGEVNVSIAGAYEYQFYNYALIAEMILSFLLFVLLVLLGIRTKMEYIRRLRDEIEILEGGSLDYRITVKGKDEISELAEGLENMRLSIRNLIEQEAKIVQENQKIITEMSHDLRTPVTSIMLYTEILKQGNYQGEAQRKEFIDKIDKKARRMKQLTDNLFEYSLVTGETEVELEEKEFCETLFFDLFSETCNYLEQRGFQVDFQVKWPEVELRICMDYLVRIMDNITSNLVKYADPDYPITIFLIQEEKKIGFVFKNVIKVAEEKVESTSVGIQSIQTMMKNMGGICRTEEEGRNFSIGILFPVEISKYKN